MLRQPNVVNGLTTNGISLSLVDFNRLYESVSDRAIIVNDFNMRLKDDKDKLNQLLYTEYDSDILDTCPTCDCGELKGEYNVGVTCTVCNTRVIPVTERAIESTLWIRVPDGIHGFITPIAWTILNEMFKNIPRWLCDSTFRYKPNKIAEPIVDHFKSIGWKRNINHLYENFDYVMETLLNYKKLMKNNTEHQWACQFIEENKHLFFCKYLPIPHRSVFITEKTSMGTFVDAIIRSAIDAVRTITSIEGGILGDSVRIRENRTVQVMNQLSAYYDEYVKSNIGRKPGMMRRQIFGSRLDFSARAVISSISGPHTYDEIHIPWGLAILLLKTHIMNKLLRMGFSPDSAEELLMTHVKTYHPLIREVLDTLIAESKGLSLKCLLNRNPSLTRASTQNLRITKVKSDPKVTTISLSVLVLSGPNADFDRLVAVASIRNGGRIISLIAGTLL